MEPEANELMIKVGATDSCHLHVANSELRLLCAKDGRLLVAWPLTCLRRYMSTRGMFTVEAGRRAPTGEGKFTFLTPQHDEIYKLLDSVIRSRASSKTSASPSHETLKKTKSVPSDNTSGVKDVSYNGYDQLIATSPGTDQQMSPGTSNSMKNAYAAPYGHLPSRDAMKTAPPLMGKAVPQVVAPGNRLSMESDEVEQFDTLNHPGHGSEEHLQQQSQKGVVGDEYCTLDQRLSPAKDTQDMYNTLHHHDTSQSLASSQHQNQASEGVYNVLGEILQPEMSTGIQSIEEDTYNTLSMKSSSQSHTTAPQVEETYNTLDHTTTVQPSRKPILLPSRTDSPGRPRNVKTPPKPLTRKTSGELKKCHTSHSPSVQEGDDMYNTLDTKTRPPPRPVRKLFDQQTTLQKSKSVSLDEDEGDTYNTLETSKTLRPPPPPPPPAHGRKTSEQIQKLQKSQSIPVDENDMYNTLDMTKVGHSPVPVRRLQAFKTSIDEGDEMYNTLDAATRVGTRPTLTPRLSDQSLKSVDSNEMYNTLDATRAGTTSNPMRIERKNNELASALSRNDDTDDNLYNTLDKSRVGFSTSVPVIPLHHGSNPNSPQRSPVKKDSPSLLKRNSSSSLQSVRCPLDVTESQLEGPHRTSSLDDLDSYTSVDYSTLSPPKAGLKPPVPAQRASNSKGSTPKARKGSAPDIISIATVANSGKDRKKGGKSGIVLNLKASLEAGGLDFSKPRRKPKKLSRDDSEDLPTHAEVEEHSVTLTPTDDVFAPGTPPIRAGRSSSSPADPSQGEDIYDELEQSVPRPKSLQITKAKKSPKK